MIFSKDKWNGGKEIGAYVPVSASLSFQKMEASLSSAASMFVLPMTGRALMERIEAVYAAEERTDAERELLDDAQRAVANLAFWHDFDALNLRISDQGFQRQGSEDWQGAYKYQEDRMREMFKTRGFNALDALLDHVEEHIDEFPEYKDTETWRARRTAIVRGPRDVDRFVNISGSHIVFERLRTEFRTVEEYALRPLLGDELYRRLRAWLEGKEDWPETAGCALEELRLRCADMVVRKAVARLMRQTGSLTDRGLYFNQTAAGTYTDKTTTAATDQQIGNRTALAEVDAERAAAALQTFLKEYLGDYVAGQTDTYNVRRNDGHRAFFTL